MAKIGMTDAKLDGIECLNVGGELELYMKEYRNGHL